MEHESETPPELEELEESSKSPKNQQGFSVEDIRFVYITDPNCPERVVAIARAFVDDRPGHLPAGQTALFVAWCVNKVESGYFMGGTVVLDPFMKKRARQILRGRLMSGNYKKYTTIEHISDKTHCAQRALQHVANAPSVPFVVRKAVRASIDARELRRSPPYAGLIAAFGEEILKLDLETAQQIWDCVDLAGKIVESSPPEAMEGPENAEIPTS
jgi:hypothetical protein